MIVVAALVTPKGLNMKNSYFTWKEFTHNYNAEVSSASSVFNRMVSDGF